MIKLEGLPFLADSGQVEEALAESGPLVEQAEAAGGIGALYARSIQLRLLVQRGEPLPNADVATRLADSARSTGVPEHAVIGFAGAAQLLLAHRESRKTKELLAELATIPGVRADPYYGSYLPQFVRCALAVGDPALASELARDTKPRTPLIEHSLSTVHAAISEVTATAEAALLYAEVADRWQQFGNVPEQAQALLGQGRCLVGAGDPRAARPLRQARNLFTKIGYLPAIAETDNLLADAEAMAM